MIEEAFERRWGKRGIAERKMLLNASDIKKKEKQLEKIEGMK